MEERRWKKEKIGSSTTYLCKNATWYKNKKIIKLDF